MKNINLFIGITLGFFAATSNAAEKFKFDRFPQQVGTIILESLARETHIMCASESGKFLSIKLTSTYDRDSKGKWVISPNGMGTNISRQDSGWVISEIHWLGADPVKDKITDGTVLEISGPSMAHFGTLNVTFTPSAIVPHNSPGFKAKCEGKIVDFSTDNKDQLIVNSRNITAAADQTGYFLWKYRDKKGQEKSMNAANGLMTVKEVIARVPSIK